MDSLAFASYTAEAGVAGLASFQLLLDFNASKARQAALGFFVAVTALAGLNALQLLAPPPAAVFVFCGALLAALTPLLWLYVTDIVADAPSVWRLRDALLFAPAGLFLLVAAGLAPFSPEQLKRFVETPSGEPILGGLSTFVNLLTVVLAAQGAITIVLILRKLDRLHDRLKQVVSNSQGRDLVWLRIVSVLLLLTGAIAILDNLGLVSVPEAVSAGAGLVFTLAVATWAVRQAPVFQLGPGLKDRLRTPEAPRDEEREPDSTAQKYEKSLLDDARLDRIAQRIAAAFDSQALHLDSNLSLRKLASATAVSETHLSQTFTRRLQTSFFDYVNARRVEEAQRLLSSSDETIIAIALQAGFNSRSAFYNAFRQITGVTPTAFRATQTSNATAREKSHSRSAAS